MVGGVNDDDDVGMVLEGVDDDDVGVTGVVFVVEVVVHVVRADEGVGWISKRPKHSALNHNSLGLNSFR